MTDIWFECPACKKEIHPTWDTYELATASWRDNEVCPFCKTKFSIWIADCRIEMKEARNND